MKISPTTAPTAVNTEDLGPLGGLQLQFAKLQLQESKNCQQRAEEYCQHISATQRFQAECGQWVNKLRDYQEKARLHPFTPPDPEMVKFFKENKITFSGSSTGNAFKCFLPEPLPSILKFFNVNVPQKILDTIALPLSIVLNISAIIVPKELMADIKKIIGLAIVIEPAVTDREWGQNIENIKSNSDQKGAQVQEMMVHLQNFVGKYNAYMQGAQQMVRDAQQTNTDVLRGR